MTTYCARGSVIRRVVPCEIARRRYWNFSRSNYAYSTFHLLLRAAGRNINFKFRKELGSRGETF